MRIHSDTFVYGVLNGMKAYLLKARNLNFAVHRQSRYLPISETAMSRYTVLTVQKSAFYMADGCHPLIASVWNRFPLKAICSLLQAEKRMCSHCMHTALMPSDRKSTRLNSSHANISYAVFCLKK